MKSMPGNSSAWPYGAIFEIILFFLGIFRFLEVFFQFLKNFLDFFGSFDDFFKNLILILFVIIA
jgi:hypothetical protein